jgi:IS1 family transposase
MNNLSRDEQIEVIAALCDGLGVRATARNTGVNRETVGALALRMGCGCAELHDRMMVGLRVNRCELDELWGYVGKKQKNVTQRELAVKGDAHTFAAFAASTRTIIAHRTGKRDTDNTMEFIHDLRERVIGSEISTDGFHPYKLAIRNAFGSRIAHGIITKTYSVTYLAVKDAARRYSPAQVVAVAPEVESGVPSHISTSYVEPLEFDAPHVVKAVRASERQFSKKLEPHCAGRVALCRALQSVPSA